jgi:hypothetical protein
MGRIALPCSGLRDRVKDGFGRAGASPSYFVVSCGGAPLEVVKSYVDNQGAEAARPRLQSPTRQGKIPRPIPGLKSGVCG